MSADVRDSAGHGAPLAGAETLLQSPLVLDPGEQEEARELELEPGSKVGRYTILDRLGAGAMGVVYTAYDPRLDRRIALKLMKARPGADPARVATRVLREAQALARLSHPNVVTVHDADSLDDLVYLAMELIDGVDLTDWLTIEKRAPAEILAVFVDAARGLAAAHAAGLVHRDFKPDNVLVGKSGRVCVVDFGIARAIDAGPGLREKRPGGNNPATLQLSALSATVAPDPVDPDDDTGEAPASAPALDETDEALRETLLEDPIVIDPETGLEVEREGGPDESGDGAAHGPEVLAQASLTGAKRLTRTGALVGTPAYMAPEQHMGVRVDDRSDQFAFCVALFESLFGVHPFPHKDFVDLSMGVIAGRLGPVPSAPDVPAHVRKAVLRGLSTDPANRHASMGALIDILTGEPAKRRRRLAWSVVAGAGVLGIVALAAHQAGNRGARCEGAERHLEGVWDDGVKARAGEEFGASELPYAPRSWETTAELLDRYTEEWVQARTQACEATHVHGEQSPALLDLRMACLDRRLGRVRAFTELLSQPSPGTVLRAVELAESLPPLAPCADRERLGRGAAKTPRTGLRRDAHEHLDGALDRAALVLDTGELDTAAAQLDEIIAGAREHELHDIEILALYHHGRIAAKRGAYKKGVERLATAGQLAERVGDDELRARVWIRLAQLLTQDRELDEAIRLLGHTAALLDRLGSAASPRLRARARRTLGSALSLQGHYAPAVEALRESVASFRDAKAGDGTDLAAALNALGTVLDRSGDPDAALEVYREAVGIYERRLGADHPTVAALLNNIAVVHKVQGRLEEARVAYERSLQIRRRALGEDHPKIGQSLTNLGNVYERMGRVEDAITRYEAALDHYRRVFGDRDSRYADALYNLGVVHHNNGLHERALAYYRDALERTDPGDAGGPDNPELAFPLTGLGAVLVELGRHDEALAPLERALAIRTREGVAPLDLGEIRFALARALMATRSEDDLDAEARARELAEQASADYRAQGDKDATKSIDRWLARAFPRGQVK